MIETVYSDWQEKHLGDLDQKVHYYNGQMWNFKHVNKGPNRNFKKENLWIEKMRISETSHTQKKLIHVNIAK